MGAIEKMVAQVLEKGQKERETYLKEEKEKLALNEEKERAHLEETKEETLQKNLRSLEKEYQQLTQRYETSSRQDTLNMKQSYLGKLFEQAVMTMNQWDDETTRAFCSHAILKVPDFPDSQLIVGEYSKNALTQDWLKGVNEKKEYPITFSSEVEEKQGGFILRQGGIEYNVLFSSLIQEVQEENSFAVAEMLFEER